VNGQDSCALWDEYDCEKSSKNGQPRHASCKICRQLHLNGLCFVPMIMSLAYDHLSRLSFAKTSRNRERNTVPFRLLNTLGLLAHVRTHSHCHRSKCCAGCRVLTRVRFSWPLIKAIMTSAAESKTAKFGARTDALDVVKGLDLSKSVSICAFAFLLLTFVVLGRRSPS
jgi:hypothetical protein